MYRRFFYFLFYNLWPLWIWFISRWLLSTYALGSEFYRASQTIAPLCIYLIFYLLNGGPKGIVNGVLTLVMLGSIISGGFGFMAEYNRWLPYLHLPEYTIAYILQHLDYYLISASFLATFVPIFLLKPKLCIDALHGLFNINKEIFKTSEDTSLGSARWMSISEAQKVCSSGNLVIGEGYDPQMHSSLGGKAPLLHFDGRGHLLTVSGSGGGKTVSVAIPNCISWQGSVVVHDTKGELATMCAEHRRNLGNGRKVAILDPRNEDTDSINVLGWLSPEKDSVIEDAKAIASWMSSGADTSSKGNTEYFQNEAINLLQLIILYVVCDENTKKEERNLSIVREILVGTISFKNINFNFDTPEDPNKSSLEYFFERVQEKGENFCYGVPLQLANSCLNILKTGKGQWAGIYGHASEMTSWLSMPSLARLVCGTKKGQTYNVLDINKGNLDVFVCVPLITLDSTPGVTRLLFGALLNARFKNSIKVNDCNENILFLMDEMPRLRKLDILETARDAGRGYGITLWAIVQDLGQLEKYYGKEGLQSWQESSQVKTFFGIGDEKTAEMLSKMLGNTTIEFETTGDSESKSSSKESIFGGSNTGSSTTVNKQARALLTPDEIMRLSDDEQLVFLRSHKPLRCGKAKWYRRAEWKNVVSDEY